LAVAVGFASNFAQLALGASKEIFYKTCDLARRITFDDIVLTQNKFEDTGPLSLAGFFSSPVIDSLFSLLPYP
jgi:hypothetical protein